MVPPLAETVDNVASDVEDMPPQPCAPPPGLPLQVFDPLPGFTATNHNESGSDSDDDQPPYQPPPWHSFLPALLERARFDIDSEQSTQELLESMTPSEEEAFFSMLEEYADANDMDSDEAFLVFLGELSEYYELRTRGA